MPTSRVRNWAAVALAIVAVGVLAFGPDAYQKKRAFSIVEFAQNEPVAVRTTGMVTGSGNPILVPGGMGLFFAHEFELARRNGETRRVVVCNGHPDYQRLLVAARGRRIILRLAGRPVEDPHKAGGWWIRHLGAERWLRVEEWAPPPPLRVLG